MRRRFRKRRAALYAVAVVAVAAWLQYSGFKTAVELREAWRQEGELEREGEALKARNAALEGDIEALEVNGARVEELARRELGLAKDGEIVIRVPDKK